MKTKLLLLISLFSYQTLFAQTAPGIAVQGIARDAEKAAFVDELLTFTFDIQDPSDGHSYYKEDVQIKTDPYGVFSHIIGTSTNKVGNFNEIPFGQVHMKLVITANGVVISDAPFQYAPYAKSAENGVPTGTIMAFVGKDTDVPPGWLLCNGQTIPTNEFTKKLIQLLGESTVPDLRGMFLRGTGTSPVNGQDGPLLGETQGDDFKKHSISGTTSNDGAHSHETYFSISNVGGSPSQWMAELGDDDSKRANVGADFTVNTDTEPNHDHTISGSSTEGGNETRPVNYGVNYIIKL